MVPNSYDSCVDRSVVFVQRSFAASSWLFVMFVEIVVFVSQ